VSGNTIEDRRQTRPALSLILCSRNDSYMGNSRWRLETTLNYIGDQVASLGRSDAVEILVTDWGSDVPLQQVLPLHPAAARIVSFLWIPPDIARRLQKDSLFPEVLALNAAARRAKGEYIGRIDQDTLVGRRALEVFFDLYGGDRCLEVPLNRALLYSNRRGISFHFAARCPAYRHVAEYVRRFGQRCRLDRLEDMRDREFWTYAVGIWLIHRDLWFDCGGYDERYIHYNWMEVEMITRLRQKYPLIDFGKIVDHDFYHLGHNNPRVRVARQETGQQVNSFDLHSATSSLPYHPNIDAWGLAELKLSFDPSRETSRPARRWFDRLALAALVADMTLQSLLTKAYLPTLKYKRRVRVVWTALRGEPLPRWPRVLEELWMKWSDQQKRSEL